MSGYMSMEVQWNNRPYQASDNGQVFLHGFKRVGKISWLHTTFILSGGLDIAVLSYFVIFGGIHLFIFALIMFSLK